MNITNYLIFLITKQSLKLFKKLSICKLIFVNEGILTTIHVNILIKICVEINQLFNFT